MASSDSGSPTDDYLDSWKEIASHFQRDVRTVKRWEQTEGLPVHRHTHTKRASIFAYRGELDAWWENRSSGPREATPSVETDHSTIGAAGVFALVLVGLSSLVFWPKPATVRVAEYDSIVSASIETADLRPEDFEANAGAMSNLLMRANDASAARPYFLRARRVAPEFEIRYSAYLPRTELFPTYQYWLEGEASGASRDADRIAATLSERSASERTPLIMHLHSVYLTLGRFDSARSLVRMQDMRSTGVELALADIAAAAGDDELTRKHLENWQRAARLEGQKRRPALFLLARSGLDLGMVRTRPPNLSPRLTNLYRLNDGMRAVGQHRHREAIRLLQDGLGILLQSNSDSALQIYRALAEAHIAVGGAEAAVTVLEEASRLRGRAAVTGRGYFIRNQWWLSQLYRDLGRTTEAEAVEAELLRLLAVADSDHYVLRALARRQAAGQPPAN